MQSKDSTQHNHMGRSRIQIPKQYQVFLKGHSTPVHNSFEVITKTGTFQGTHMCHFVIYSPYIILCFLLSAISVSVESLITVYHMLKIDNKKVVADEQMTSDPCVGLLMHQPQ